MEILPSWIVSKPILNLFRHTELNCHYALLSHWKTGWCMRWYNAANVCHVSWDRQLTPRKPHVSCNRGTSVKPSRRVWWICCKVPKSALSKLRIGSGTTSCCRWAVFKCCCTFLWKMTVRRWQEHGWSVRVEQIWSLGWKSTAAPGGESVRQSEPILRFRVFMQPILNQYWTKSWKPESLDYYWLGVIICICFGIFGWMGICARLGLSRVTGGWPWHKTDSSEDTIGHDGTYTAYLFPSHHLHNLPAREHGFFQIGNRWHLRSFTRHKTSANKTLLKFM